MVANRSRSPVTILLVSFVSVLVLGLVFRHLEKALDRQHLPKQLCHAAGEKAIQVVVAVRTSPNNYDTRQAIRSSMASPAVRALLPWQVVFYMGHSLDRKTSHALRREALKGDIIITPYQHHARNTVKCFLHAIRWVHERCEPNLRYFIHTNDSTMVDLVAAYEYIWNMSVGNRYFYCSPVSNVPVDRDANSPTYVSETQFSKPHFSTFCEGDAFIVPAELLKTLVKVSQAIAQYPLLGPYVTGDLARVAEVGHRNISTKIYAISGEPPQLNCTATERPIFITNVSVIAQWKSLWIKTLVCYRNQTPLEANTSKIILQSLKIELLE
ncbi:acetylgalactosaminyl-O-glycosyl-glycoprotein beta-1,3-N-acetylglucosaminyltransferase-like [Haemaphysalis longicornis]